MLGALSALCQAGSAVPTPASGREAQRMTPLEDGEGERGLGVSWWRHRGRGLWALPCSRQPEVSEDPCDNGGVVDRGDQLHPPGAARAAQDVQVECPAHQRRPRPVAGLRGAPAFGFTPLHGPVRTRRWVTLGATVGNDLRPPARVRREDTVVEDQVDRRPRRQRRQLLEELHRLEEQVRRAVAPGPLQLPPHAAVAQQPQPVVGEWRGAAQRPSPLSTWPAWRTVSAITLPPASRPRAPDHRCALLRPRRHPGTR